MSPGRDPSPSAWNDAILAITLAALDPAGLSGIHVKSRAGPVRDRWLEEVARIFASAGPMQRVAAGISEARLSGGLDIGLSIRAARPVLQQGVLASVDGGVLVIAMAERLTQGPAALIAGALDDGEARTERDGISARHPARFTLIALDEGIDEDEALPPSLDDRLGLRIDLNAIRWRETEGHPALGAVATAAALLPSVSIGDEMMQALCALALGLGASSLRLSLHLLRAAKAAAALRGSSAVEPQDAATAVRLVAGVPAPPQAEEEQDTDEQDESEGDRPEPQEPELQESQPEGALSEDSGESPKATGEMLVEAIQALLPDHLLLRLQSGAARRGTQATAGRMGAERDRGTRGRPVGIAAKPPVPGARLDLLATLRQAAPWQRLRGRAADASPQTARLRIRKQDFRYVRYRNKTGTTAIFAVDASGSAAVERLAETKGAVELLLAECYVRRDSVALIAFRGRQAETLLEPTRSLVRAKRELSALPGGGGTPLAGGILAALSMACAAARKGQEAVVVFLTDGRGNVALDGTTSRERVGEDTGRAARQFRASRVRSILIDTAGRPQARASDLARDLGAEYLALPRGNARAVAREVGARMEG